MPDIEVVHGFHGALTIDGVKIADLNNVVIRMENSAFYMNSRDGILRDLDDEMTIVLAADWFIDPARERYERWRYAWEDSI